MTGFFTEKEAFFTHRNHTPLIFENRFIVRIHKKIMKKMSLCTIADLLALWYHIHIPVDYAYSTNNRHRKL